jgi:Protein of unknown function (DUF2384)
LETPPARAVEGRIDVMTGWPSHGGAAAQLDRPAVDPDAEAQVVAKAAVRAAEMLDIGPMALAKVMGLSPASAARLCDGRFELPPVGAPFVRAVLFVRAFVALDAIMGGDEQAARSWLRTFNAALRDTPLDVMQTPRGLAQVALHLEARLAR